MEEFSLLYVSKATRSLSLLELRDIVDRSYLNNSVRNLTGVLLYNRQGRFLQILEGKQERVESVFAAILEDSRHTQIEVLKSGPIMQRRFADWHMKLVRTDETEADGMDRAQIEALYQHLVATCGGNSVAGFGDFSELLRVR